MSSTPSPPGSSTRQEVLAVLREWLTEANEIAFNEGGTYASVLGRALDNLSNHDPEEEDASAEPGP